MNPSLLLALLLLLGAGCSPTPDPPGPAPATAAAAPAPPVPASAPTRIDLGRQIAARTFGILSSNLTAALGRTSPAEALEFCSLNAAPLVASSAAAGAEIRRVTHRPRNPANRATPAELALIGAYQTGLEQGRTNPPVLVTNATGTVTFYAPILLGNPLCLQCHGRPESDIAPATLAAIDRLYASDQARGFRLGELRGLWAITVP